MGDEIDKKKFVSRALTTNANGQQKARPNNNVQSSKEKRANRQQKIEIE
jgi:hypothetical protein